MCLKLVVPLFLILFFEEIQANDHIVRESNGGSSFTFYFFASVIFIGAVLYKKRTEVLALLGNPNEDRERKIVVLENEQLRREVALLQTQQKEQLQELKKLQESQSRSNSSITVDRSLENERIDVLEKDVEQYKRQNETFKKEILSYKRDSDNSKNVKEDLEKEIKTLRIEISETRSKKEELENTLNSIKNDLEAVRKEKDSLELWKKKKEDEYQNTSSKEKEELLNKVNTIEKEKISLENKIKEQKQEIETNKIQNEKSLSDAIKDAQKESTELKVQLSIQKENLKYKQQEVDEMKEHLKEIENLNLKLEESRKQVNERDQLLDQSRSTTTNLFKELNNEQAKVRRLEDDLITIKLERDRLEQDIKEEKKKANSKEKLLNLSKLGSGSSLIGRSRTNSTDSRGDGTSSFPSILSKEESSEKLDTGDELHIQSVMTPRPDMSEDSENEDDETEKVMTNSKLALLRGSSKENRDDKQEEVNVQNLKSQLTNMFDTQSQSGSRSGSVDETKPIKDEIPEDLKTSLDIPDDVEDFISLKNKSKNSPVSVPVVTVNNSVAEDDFDINEFKKNASAGMQKFLSKSKQSKVKGWDSNGLKGGLLFDNNSTNDDTNSLMALLDQKGKQNDNKSNVMDLFGGQNNNTSAPSYNDSNSLKTPSFLDIFKKPDENPVKELNEDGDSSGTHLNWKPWSPGDPLVREFALRDDINKKGMRRTKKKAQYWGGGTKPKEVEMEDQYFMEFPFAHDSTRGLFCIFDGHAGANCAITAKTIFPKEMEKFLASSTNITDQTEVFKKTYEKVDNDLLPFEFEGCTSTTVLVWQVGESRYVQCANVGDSTAFLLRGDSVLPLSIDHKATSKDEKQRLIEMGIEVNENQTRISGLAVSRALGDHFLKIEKTGVIGEPYVSPSIQLLPTDFAIVIASDGLWDVMNGERAMEICKSTDNATSMARRLLQQALADPKCTDNITIMVITL